jgi:hypothetical protein
VSSSSDKDGLLEFIGVDAGVASTPQEVLDNQGNVIGTTASSTSGSIGPTGPILPANQEQVSLVGPTGMIPLDLPALDNSDDGFRMFAVLHDYGLTPFGSSWAGGFIEMSRDGGTTWTRAGSSNIRAGAVAWGISPNIVPPPADWNVRDEDTVITVNLKTGRLENGDTIMIGQEMIIAYDVTGLPGRTYELRSLLRGRRGTDAYMDSHVENEAVVHISGLVRISLTQDDYQRPIKLRATTNGLNIENADQIDVVPQFQNYIGWKVAKPQLGFDSASNTFAGRWTARYKFDSGLVNGRTNVQDDDFVGYRVAILDPNTDTIIRQISTTTTSFTYTSEQQIEDFGSNQSTLRVSIVPMGLITGAGHPSIITYGI